jgi:hypothetical protein
MKKLTGMIGAMILIGVVAMPTAAMAGGNGATSTPFKASYATSENGINIYSVCSGTHVVLQKPNNTFYKDDETCLITGDTGGFIAGSYSNNPGSPYGNVPPVGLSGVGSDSTVEPGALATSWTVTISLNRDGSVNEHIEAYYSS